MENVGHFGEKVGHFEEKVKCFGEKVGYKLYTRKVIMTMILQVMITIVRMLYF